MGDPSIGYKCNCTASDEANQNIHLGSSCQYKATEICHEEGFDGLPDWLFTHHPPPLDGYDGPAIPQPPEWTDGDMLHHPTPYFPGVSFCANHGTCKSIIPEGALEQEPDADADNAVEHQHGGCKCTDGWSGAHCQVNDGDSRAFITCPDDHTKCFNGATCVMFHRSNNAQPQQSWHCDCAAANQEHGTVFVGMQCEHHLPDLASGQSCHVPFQGFLGGADNPHAGDFQDSMPPPNLQHSFCLHGGTCMQMIEHYDSNSDISNNVNDTWGEVPVHMGCNCTEGYIGHHCEHPKHNGDPNAEVQCGKSVCRNGGQCQQHILNAKRKDACACPENFGGLSCEERIEICGDSDDHACLNGGSCVLDDAITDVWSCDCSTAFGIAGKFAAGVMCEHEATNICITGHLEHSFAESGMFFGPRFCTNHGKCQEVMDGKSGMTSMECACSQGYSGEYCEISPVELPPADVNVEGGAEEGGSGMSNAEILATFFGLMGVLTIGFAFGMKYKGQRRQQRNAPTDLVLDPDGSATMAKSGAAEESSLSSESGSAPGATAVTGEESSSEQDDGPNVEDAEII